MDRLMEGVLSIKEGQLLIPVVLAVLGTYAIKGLNGLVHMRRLARQEFLALYCESKAQSDVWLSTVVRHHFGAYLPPALIRQLLASDQPARALLDVCEGWDLIDRDEDTGRLVWRRWYHQTRLRRCMWKWTLRVTNVLVAFLAIAVVMSVLRSSPAAGVALIYWILVAEAVVLAVCCLQAEEKIKAAEVALGRWLAMG